MTNLFQHATHDQIALAFCAGALLISGSVMYFSYHIGQVTGHIRAHQSAETTHLGMSRQAEQPANAAHAQEKAA